MIRNIATACVPGLALANQSGNVQMVVKNRFLVSVDGNSVSREELLDYAKAIDLKKPAELP